ncbi:hypothetical protein Elgi_37890 [Paenibacillus elgii]|nr:hypothetical protein Elgi_37890 [Paenibacillus elgii]
MTSGTWIRIWLKTGRYTETTIYNVNNIQAFLDAHNYTMKDIDKIEFNLFQ